MLPLTLMRRSAVQGWLVLVGCALVVCGFEIVLVAQAASIEASQSFGKMTELLPAFLQRGLGQQALLLATFNGTVAFGYFHPVMVLFVTLNGVYFATEPAHDVESKRVDLLLARAVPRHRLITRSLLLSFGSVVVLVVLMAFGTWLGLHAFADGVSKWPAPRMLCTLTVHLASVAWCCGAFGLALAAGSSRWSTTFAAVALTTVVMYMLDFVAIAWPRAAALAWISPFDYFPGIPIIAGTAPVGRNLVVLWSVTIAFYGIAYWRFQRRDV